MAFGSLLRIALSLLIGGVIALGLGQPANAQVHLHPDENGTEIVRSLESLRDLDYQSWQAVAYRTGPRAAPSPCGSSAIPAASAWITPPP